MYANIFLNQSLPTRHHTPRGRGQLLRGPRPLILSPRAALVDGRFRRRRFDLAHRVMRRCERDCDKGTQSRCCGAHVTLFASEKVKTEKLERSSHGPARPVHARYRNPEADTPPYRTPESERETETERESERQATRGRATRPGQPGAPVTRRTAARDTVLRIPRA